MTFRGGIHLTKHGVLIGAVGVSGSSVENDHLVAPTGAHAL